MKLWQKDFEVEKKVSVFTIGKDQDFDLVLAPFDVMGSLAHLAMLKKIKLVTASEAAALRKGLLEIYQQILSGTFTIPAEVEDVHSQIELMLTRNLGDAGKKIHSGRSRNDQVLVAIKLYLREAIHDLTQQTGGLARLLLEKSETYRDYLLPGYTHMQVAMPSSFGLWFGAYAESLTEDLLSLKAAYDLTNRNPLGSGAGYGSSFPLDRALTTSLLGFEGMHVNVVNAQMSRGKTEKSLGHGLSMVAGTLAKLAMDVCLYMGQNHGFISFPDALTTGSSIMPHKKNPDVFEITRGQCNRIQAVPNELSILLTNLPSGYHRELQLTKEILFPAIENLKACIDMTAYMLNEIKVKKDLLRDPRYTNIYSVEALNQLVLEGIPFRDAYKKIAASIDSGEYKPPEKVHHTHIGSIGNPGTALIEEQLKANMAAFNFTGYQKAIRQLLKS